MPKEGQNISGQAVIAQGLGERSTAGRVGICLLDGRAAAGRRRTGVRLGDVVTSARHRLAGGHRLGVIEAAVAIAARLGQGTVDRGRTAARVGAGVQIIGVLAGCGRAIVLRQAVGGSLVRPGFAQAHLVGGGAAGRIAARQVVAAVAGRGGQRVAERLAVTGRSVAAGAMADLRGGRAAAVAVDSGEVVVGTAVAIGVRSGDGLAEGTAGIGATVRGGAAVRTGGAAGGAPGNVVTRFGKGVTIAARGGAVIAQPLVSVGVQNGAGAQGREDIAENP